MGTPKDRMIASTLDLLRHSGLAGAGVNQVIDASGAPKGSLYNYFPGGKLQLVTTALKEAESAIGASLASIFSQRLPLAKKVITLFNSVARNAEADSFTRSCPVAA